MTERESSYSVTTPCVRSLELLEQHMRETWNILELSGVADKFVDASATITHRQVKEDRQYAIVIYEEGVETEEQISFVIAGLKELGLDVEEPKPIKFHPKKE